jgi:Bacterial PH domain
MDLRPPTVPHSDGPDHSAGETVWWGVMRKVVVVKVVGAIVFLIIAVASFGDPVQFAVTAVAALWLTALAGRDVLVPVRVLADVEGLTVAAGFAGRRHLPWSAVERVRVDERSRFGLRSQLLEIDTGEDLYFFSTYELGAPVEEVAQVLQVLRHHSSGPRR